MSTRCKCCNRKLSDSEISFFNEELQEYEDMCGICRSASLARVDYFNEHEYTLQDLKEGLSPPLNSKY